jgi:hypothetical protein
MPPVYLESRMSPSVVGRLQRFIRCQPGVRLPDPLRLPGALDCRSVEAVGDPVGELGRVIGTERINITDNEVIRRGRVVGKFARKYTLRLYPFLFNMISNKFDEFSTLCCLI